MAIQAQFKRYGLVGVAFLHLAVSRGLRGVYGVFYVAFLEAFGWTRAATAGAISLSVIFEGVSFPVVGSLTDRIGPRKTLILGGIVLVLGVALSATISSLWELYLWLGIVTAVGMGMIGMVPHVSVISREFQESRGTMLGLAYAGGGFGILLMVPISQVMINHWGWSLAYIGIAIIAAFLVIPPALFFSPQSIDNSAVPTKKTEIGKPTDWTVSQALGTSVFWLLFSARVLASMGNHVIVTHVVAHSVDVGYTKLFSASIFGMMGVVSIFGKVWFGYLSDRLKKEWVFTLIQGISSLGIVALLLMKDNSQPWILYTYAIFYGIGQGSRALVLSAISADLFLGRNFGAIYGYFTLSIGVGGAMGAWLGGYLHDLTGNYFVAFLFALSCFAFSIVSVWSIREIADKTNHINSNQS